MKKLNVSTSLRIAVIAILALALVVTAYMTYTAYASSNVYHYTVTGYRNVSFISVNTFALLKPSIISSYQGYKEFDMPFYFINLLKEFYINITILNSSAYTTKYYTVDLYDPQFYNLVLNRSTIEGSSLVLPINLSYIFNNLSVEIQKQIGYYIPEPEIIINIYLQGSNATQDPQIIINESYGRAFINVLNNYESIPIVVQYRENFNPLPYLASIAVEGTLMAIFILFTRANNNEILNLLNKYRKLIITVEEEPKVQGEAIRVKSLKELVKHAMISGRPIYYYKDKGIFWVKDETATLVFTEK
ncbi:MAG: DUF5305 family protein [Sulfolobaceae archaeon]|nr:DUF5305 family protein [Sulfolobaceae archaeon]